MKKATKIIEGTPVAAIAFLEGLNKAKRLTNQKLTELVIANVWGKMPLGTKEELLLNEMIHRFQKLAKVKL